MLYAILICTDQSCAEEFEAWGEPDEFDELLCERCEPPSRRSPSRRSNRR